MLKRSVALLMVSVFFAALCIPALADETDKSAYFDENAAESFLIAESVSKTVVASKAEDEKLNVAGLLRMAPLLLICEAVDNGMISKDADIKVSREAASLGGVSAFLETGEKIKAELLLKSAIMIGASDAVYALSESIYKNEAAFLDKLNERLIELGVESQYHDIMGNDVKLSARELMYIGCAMVESETFKSYSSLFYDSITHEDGRETELANPNKLVRYFLGCNGILTGSSNEAGYCGVFAITRNDSTYICVTLGSENSSSRFELAKAITEYAFGAYKSLKAANKGDVMAENISVAGGIRSNVDLVAQNDCMLIFENGSSYEAFSDIPDVINAPVSKNDTVGRIEYKTADGKIIGTVMLCPQNPVEKAGFWDNVCNILHKWLHA